MKYLSIIHTINEHFRYNWAFYTILAILLFLGPILDWLWPA